jgi:hypothetical protein
MVGIRMVSPGMAGVWMVSPGMAGVRMASPGMAGVRMAGVRLASVRMTDAWNPYQAYASGASAILSALPWLMSKMRSSFFMTSAES